jgi:hypothetical protein
MARKEQHAQLAFTILDERDSRADVRQLTGYFHPLETRTLSDIYRIIFERLGIPTQEREYLHISFRINNDTADIRYPSELLGYDSIVAAVSERDGSNALSEMAENDRARPVEAHINPMPAFFMHRSLIPGVNKEPNHRLGGGEGSWRQQSVRYTHGG